MNQEPAAQPTGKVATTFCMTGATTPKGGPTRRCLCQTGLGQHSAGWGMKAVRSYQQCHTHQARRTLTQPCLALKHKEASFCYAPVLIVQHLHRSTASLDKSSKATSCIGLNKPKESQQTQVGWFVLLIVCLGGQSILTAT